MNKFYYLAFIDPNHEPSIGIIKKINYQINEFKKHYFEVFLDLSYKKNKFLYKLSFKIPFLNPFKNLFDINRISTFDILYIRKPFINGYFINYLKKIKQSGLKIIIEFPTFPYEKELSKSPLNFFLNLREIFFRKYLNKYVDFIVTYSNHNEILNIPTIKIHNGIDFNQIKIRKFKKINSNINIMIVGSLGFWHGVDKLMDSYVLYKKKNGKLCMNLHIIGNGNIIRMLANKAIKSSFLKNNVFFHGTLKNEKLDYFYNTCNFAIDTLALDRKGVVISSSLKSREYLAKGIPIISCANIDVIEDKWKYFLKIDSILDKIDFNLIVSFYYKLYNENNIEIMTNEIREFGNKYASIESSLAPIICKISNDSF